MHIITILTSGDGAHMGDNRGGQSDPQIFSETSRGNSQIHSHYTKEFYKIQRKISKISILIFLAVKPIQNLFTAIGLQTIWVTGCRTGKKLTKCHFFFKVRSWYGQIKAKFDILSSPTISS